MRRRPVDTSNRPAHFRVVSKKPRKVNEPQAPYPAKKQRIEAAPAPSPTAGSPRFAELEKVRANNAKLIQVHSKVLQKLAQ